MITYPHHEYLPELWAEMLEKTTSLPPYLGGPGVDYTGAMQAYALNVLLLHDPDMEPGVELHDYPGPGPAAEVALVERGNGHGIVGSFSGVSGYIDTLRDPAEPPDPAFDPIYYTVCAELSVECGLNGDAVAGIRLAAGQSFEEKRTFFQGAMIRIVPVLGICATKPDICVDGKEVLSHRWARLSEVRHMPKLENGFYERTLPHSLGALGLDAEQVQRLLHA